MFAARAAQSDWLPFDDNPASRIGLCGNAAIGRGLIDLPKAGGAETGPPYPTIGDGPTRAAIYLGGSVHLGGSVIRWREVEMFSERTRRWTRTGGRPPHSGDRGCRSMALITAGSLLAAILVTGCAGAPGASQSAGASHRLPPTLGTRPMTSCVIKGEIPVKAEVPGYCGTLEVPEDRSNPSGRQVPLNVAVVPAVAATPAPDPFFPLAGGRVRAHRSSPGFLASIRGPRQPRHRPRRPARHRWLEPDDLATDARHLELWPRRLTPASRHGRDGLASVRRRSALLYEHRGRR